LRLSNMSAMVGTNEHHICTKIVRLNAKIMLPFIHEMTHVLQFQSGIHVLLDGFFLQSGKFLSLTLYNPYSYV